MAAKVLMQFLRSNMMTGAGFTAIGSGFYVIYIDSTRYIKIGDAFARGCVLPPMSDNQNQTPYFRRPLEESHVTKILEPKFTNEYYFIHGEVGTGKTRLILECVQDLIATSGKEEKGAPIYVLASQGKSFPDTLAASVNFSFDEHISFRFFVSYLLGIHSMPGKNEEYKLRRVLDAIEEASFHYMKKYGRPAVIVIDDTNHLAVHLPGALQKIQEKAKLWADTNIAKIVLVSNDEETEAILQANQSSWSRADNPLYIGDLTQEEAIRFLKTTCPCVLSNKPTPTDTPGNNCHIENRVALQITELVGGRVQHLLQFRRDLQEGVAFAESASRLKGKEREKLLMLQKHDSAVVAVTRLMAEPGLSLTMDQFTKVVSMKDFIFLITQNILSIKRQGACLVVKFDSQLTETVTKDWLDTRSK